MEISFMKKKVVFPLVLLLILFTSCGMNRHESGSEQNVSEVMRIDELHNGDAKFWNDGIVTSNSEGLIIIEAVDANNSRHTYESVKANWIDAIEGEDFVIYANSDNQIGICSLDNNYEMKENKILMQNDDLCIDLSITKDQNMYYMTATHISGPVNNADINAQNGHYKIELYRSSDLTHWENVSTIAESDHNLEDVKLINDNGQFILVYEEETADKGSSRIMLTRSKDQGKTWEKPMELLGAEADQEPAGFEKNGNQWLLYYSSDIKNPGTSYGGAAAYYAAYDEAFKLISKDNTIPTSNEQNLILYDVRTVGEYLQLLYTHDYFNESNLVVDQLLISDIIK